MSKIINYNALFYGHKIMETGSIKVASEQLGMAQSTLSEQLKQLEDSLGKKLFLRGKKGLTITPEGQALQKYTHLIFKTAERIKHQFSVKTPEKIAIDVGILPSILNSRTSRFLLPMFLNEKIFIKIHQGDSQYLIKSFLHNEIDILFTDYKLKIESLPNLRNVPLGSANYVLVYNPKYAAIKKTFDQEQGTLPYLQYSIMSEVRWHGEQFFYKKKFHLDPIGECDDALLAKEIVVNVPCCAMLPLSFVKDDLETKNLALLNKVSVYKSPLYANYSDNQEAELIEDMIITLKKSLSK